MPMTAKERVMTSLAWQDPDRVPLQIYLTPETRAKLAPYHGNRDILDFFAIDLRFVQAPYHGAIAPAHDGVFYDLWGTGYTMVDFGDGSYPEASVLPLRDLQTLDDVENFPWPRVEDFDFSTIEAQCDALGDYAVCFGDAGTPDIVNGVSRGRGMEQVLMDIALADEVGMAIIDKRVDICYEYCKRALEAGKGKIDILCLGEDCGTQNGRLFPPAIFASFFVPRLKKFYDLAHAYGAKAMMHSCGDTSDIQPTFIEMGLDILDAMQPEPAGMDVVRIREQCRGKLAFCGLLSTQQTLPYGSEADCRAEARHRLDVIAPGGGYIFSPAHCLQADTPVENILAIYEEALGRPLR